MEIILKIDKNSLKRRRQFLMIKTNGNINTGLFYPTKIYFPLRYLISIEIKDYSRRQLRTGNQFNASDIIYTLANSNTIWSYKYK